VQIKLAFLFRRYKRKVGSLEQMRLEREKLEARKIQQAIEDKKLKEKLVRLKKE